MTQKSQGKWSWTTPNTLLEQLHFMNISYTLFAKQTPQFHTSWKCYFLHPIYDSFNVLLNLEKTRTLPDVLLEVPCFILTKRWCAHVRVMEAVWRPGWGRVLRANWLKLKIWRNTSDYYYLAYLKDYRQISVFNRSELVTKFLAIQKLYESNKLELKYSNYNLY